MIKVGVVPMGHVPVMATKVIATHVYAYFDLRADVLARLPVPMDAFDSGRMQYDAGQVLTGLEKVNFKGYQKIIGVMNGDLFVPIFEYVLGEARQGGRCALVSLFRLDEKMASGPIEPSHFLERCAKVALHELGHLFNLTHCSDPLCLMHISGDARELDQRRFNLCRYCMLFFRKGLSRH
jgi:archaemetzincin